VELIRKISKELNLETTLHYSNGEKKVELASSPEVRGIKCSDNRKYIFDLLRMQPRDLNWVPTNFDPTKPLPSDTPNPYETCVLRNVIIKNFDVYQ
jgi:Clustered mitochondria